MTTDPKYAFIKLYTPAGVQVSLPIPVDGSIIGTQEAQGVMTSVTNYLSAGFLVREVGVEEGEQKDMVGWVCRRAKIEDDGSETNILDFYVDHEAMQHRFMTVYLDDQARADAFFAASGVRHTALPLYEGAKPLDRTERLAKVHVIRMPQPFGIITKLNPRYVPDVKDSKVPKRLFVRYADAPVIVASPAQPAEQGDPFELEKNFPRPQIVEKVVPWNREEMQAFAAEYQAAGHTHSVALAALKVTGLASFKGTLEQARRLLADHVRVEDVPF